MGGIAGKDREDRSSAKRSDCSRIACDCDEIRAERTKPLAGVRPTQDSSCGDPAHGVEGVNMT